jgi:DNA-binding response OmpR family regulator
MNILVAEDDRNFGFVFKNELAQEGHSVDLATDGVEAVLKFIERLPHGGYDFVLLDIKMPRLDGINALRIIRKLDTSVPAITYSGNAGSGEMAEAVRAGAIRCLTKPFDIGRLKEDIRKYSKRS